MAERIITNEEIRAFWRFASRSVESMIACLEGLGEEDLNWRPPTENANPLYVLPMHMMGNMEEVVLGILCGKGTGGRERDAEFKVAGSSAETAKERWKELKERIAASLAELPADALDRTYDHPRRGRISGHQILMIVASHAAEHNGQAKLTRDLLLSARGRPIPRRDY